ncbi:MAG: hypothetical protein MUO76_16965 [Anaerolineaceae bacterium]|nr:hypothetical protein [Anaerolineaceae bacterium]
MLNLAAQNMIERYFLRPGQVITEVSRLGEAVVVSAGRLGWLVESVGDINSARPCGYELYEVRINLAADPPPPAHGVAVLPDGEMFHLNDESELRAFFRKVYRTILPLELAGLLTRYQAGDNPQKEILQRDTLSWWLADDQIEAIDEFTLPLTIRKDNGGLTLDFCALTIDQELPNGMPIIGLNRWCVEVYGEGRLEWSFRPIAGKLDTRIYSAK